MSDYLLPPKQRLARESLREALIRLIMRDGYDSVSIQDIANESETARIAFYRHYRDKDELLADCLNTVYEALVDKKNPRILEAFQEKASAQRWKK